MPKLVAISDTHLQFPDLKNHAGTYLVHSGDYESGDNLPEHSVQIGKTFLNWLGRQKNFMYKLFVPGNHDAWFWANPTSFKTYAASQGVIVLDQTVIELSGIKFYGTPYLYTCRRNSELKVHIPSLEEFQVLVTHVPPKGVFDFEPSRRENIGSDVLRDYINENKVRLHLFGHCHEGYGQAGPYHNVSMASRNSPKKLIHPPTVIDVGYLKG